MNPILLDLPTEITTERLLLRTHRPGDGAIYFRALRSNWDRLIIPSDKRVLNKRIGETPANRPVAGQSISRFYISQSNAIAQVFLQKLLTSVRSGSIVEVDVCFPAIPRALIAATQGPADDQGGRCAWVAVIAADKTIDHTRPTCRQGFRRTLLRRFGQTRQGLETVWWVLSFFSTSSHAFLISSESRARQTTRQEAFPMNTRIRFACKQTRYWSGSRRPRKI